MVTQFGAHPRDAEAYAISSNGIVISGRSLPARILLNVSASDRVQSYLRPVSAAHVALLFSIRHSQVKHLLFNPPVWSILRELSLLSGIGILPSHNGMRRMRQYNLMSALIAVATDAKASTNLPHSSSREGRLSTGRWNFGVFSLTGDQRNTCARGSFVQRNSVRSLQIRCMTTA